MRRRTWFCIKTFRKYIRAPKISGVSRWDLKASTSPFPPPAAVRHATVPVVTFLGPGTLPNHTCLLFPYKTTGRSRRSRYKPHKMEGNIITGGNVWDRRPKEGQKDQTKAIWCLSTTDEVTSDTDGDCPELGPRRSRVAGG